MQYHGSVGILVERHALTVKHDVGIAYSGGPTASYTSDMDANQLTWDSLRSKSYSIDDFYVQSGVGPAGGRILVVINGVAMPFEDARALDRGVVTLDEIARHRTVR